MNTLVVLGNVWFILGRIGAVIEILERIAAEPDSMKFDVMRAGIAILAGKVKTARYRFEDAESSLRIASNVLNPETNFDAYYDQLTAGVELELHRRDANAARTKLEALEEKVEALPGNPVYYTLRLRRLRARLALLEGDAQTAYNESMSGFLEAKGGGFRLLEIEYLKYAAKVSQDRKESEGLRADAIKLADEITAQLDDELRAEIREHLLEPPRESMPEQVSDSEEETSPESSGALLRLAVFLAREDDPQRGIDAILDVAFNTMDAERAFLIVREQDGLIFSGSRYASGAVPDSPESEVSKSIIDRVIETGAPVFSERAKDETVFAAFRSIVDMELLSILALPVRIGGEVQGCLYLDNSNRPAAFSAEDRRHAEYLASMSGAVLERQLLFQQIREASESLNYKFQKQSAEFEIVRKELEQNRRSKTIESILGQSPAIRRHKEAIERSAATDLPMLLTGQSGTGKDIAAKTLHEISRRSKAPFITVNCGAIPEQLFQAEAFGVERGAYTGAEETKPGLFELADGGTIFLDEISDLPPPAQNALLGVTAEGTIRRVGGREPISIDIRIISATNRNMEDLVRQRKFREDLYYRLNTIEINVPPLGEREGDIPALAAHFLEKIAEAHNGRSKPLSRVALEKLESYPWPGNVRQLRNVLERAYVMAETRITPAHLKLELEKPPARSTGESMRLADAERAHILKVLAANGGQIRATARELGIDRNTLRRKLALYQKEGHLS
jgi:transcriptional regulator with GAF, ATPase, and Fis domain